MEPFHFIFYHQRCRSCCVSFRNTDAGFGEQLLHRHQLLFILDLSHDVEGRYFGDLKSRCSVCLFKGCDCDHFQRFTGTIKTFNFLPPMCENLAVPPKIVFFTWGLTTANCTGLLRWFRLLTSEHLRNLSGHVRVRVSGNVFMLSN